MTRNSTEKEKKRREEKIFAHGIARNSTEKEKKRREEKRRYLPTE
jgi:hypothetical protein